MKSKLSRSRASRVRLAMAATTVTAAAALAISAAPAMAVTTSLTDVKINEVESNADAVHGDWIELYNTGIANGDDVDLSGVILSDNDNSHSLVIPSGTIIGYQDFVTIRVDDPAVSGNFGLGSSDSARLFAPGATPGVTAPLDSYTWTSHAATTYGRNPDGTGAFATTTSSTYNAPNDFGAPSIGNIDGVKLNEVESNGDVTNGDWVELYNTTNAAINIDGSIITDSDPAHQFVVPSSTPNLPAGGYAAFRVDDPAVTGNFGLGSTDSVSLYPPNDTSESHLEDTFSWSTHATVTYGRTVAGAGSWAQTSVSTFAAANQFSGGAAPSLTGVVINEAESSGDDTHGDWVELKNTSGSSVTLDNAILSDNNNGHVFRIPTGTTLAAGALAAFRVDDPALGDGQFGLGDNDSVRLFKADAVDLATATPVDTQSWSTHAVRTYGLNGSGVWSPTNAGTFGTANDFSSTITPDISDVVLNEVVSTGDTTHGDWVELLNTSGSSINIGGAILSDENNTNTYTIPTGTMLAAGATYVLQTQTTAGWGLDGNDQIRFYRAGSTVGTSIPLDHFEWTKHAAGSYARQGSGFGDWIVDATPSYNAAN
jgi:hypothetical protein